MAHTPTIPVYLRFCSNFIHMFLSKGRKKSKNNLLCTCPVPACVVSISLGFYFAQVVLSTTVLIFAASYIVARKIEPDIYFVTLFLRVIIHGSVCSSVTILSLFISGETFTWLAIYSLSLLI